MQNMLVCKTLRYSGFLALLYFVTCNFVLLAHCQAVQGLAKVIYLFIYYLFVVYVKTLPVAQMAQRPMTG
jgi:hypothetical protein